LSKNSSNIDLELLQVLQIKILFQSEKTSLFFFHSRVSRVFTLPVKELEAIFER